VIKKLRGSHQHAGRADATLRAAMPKKCFLYGVQFSIERETLHGLDDCAFGLQHGNEATIYEFAIHADRTRAAFAFAASFLGTGQVQVFSEHIKQTLQRWNTYDSRFSIYDEANCGPAIVRRCTLACAHRAAASSAV
jgi:hypothetical protein